MKKSKFNTKLVCKFSGQNYNPVVSRTINHLNYSLIDGICAKKSIFKK